MNQRVIKCYNCPKAAIYQTHEGIPFCLDCYAKWKQIQDANLASLANMINYLDDQMRFSILGGEPPRLKVTQPIQATIRQGDLHMNNIKIDNSTIGILNTGHIQDVKNIDVNITALAQSGKTDIAGALKALTESVVSDSNISAEQKTEVLDQLNELSSQATLPADKRAKTGVIKAVVTGLATGLGSVASLAKIWELTGDTICGYFGIDNPLKSR